MHTYYFHLGSNIGDRNAMLTAAVDQISQKIGKLVLASSIYETEPWGYKNQDHFLNQAIQVESHLSIDDVFTILQEIEKQMGGIKTETWGPRIIDIDILYCDDVIVNTDRLTVPHARMYERSFVLIPMMEIACDFIDPVKNKSIEELFDMCRDEGAVFIYEG